MRKAKELVAFLVNDLNPHWTQPVEGKSGNQIDDSLLHVRKMAWKKKEEERVRDLIKARKSSDTSALPVVKDYDERWQLKEWLTFRYLGLVKGRVECLPIFKTPPPGSGPQKKTVATIQEITEKISQTGGRDARKTAGVKLCSIIFVRVIMYYCCVVNLF